MRRRNLTPFFAALVPMEHDGVPFPEHSGKAMKARLATWFCRGLSRLAETIDTRIVPASGDRRTVYLTFDDGPHPQGTETLLDVLDRHHVPATFFLVGENAARRPHLVRRIFEAGHMIGNHSHTHIDAWRASGRTVLRDFSRGSRILERLTGQPVQRMRPPYGKVTPTLARWAIRRKQRLTLWDVLPPDFHRRSKPRQLADHLLHGARPGSIICLHDNDVSQEKTPQMLAECLPRMKQAGWTFAVLPEPQMDERRRR